MTDPLVSIICLCYNHELFLVEALNSVMAQTYANLEIIVIDDASTDGSAALIQEYCHQFPQITFISNAYNVGNCRAFNTAWRQSTGEFIIDFATDDVMLPDRVREQVKCLTGLPADYGVVYTDALLIDEYSRSIRPFYQTLANGKLHPEPFSGWIYVQAVQKFFISAPTMLIRRSVLEKLNGYNEDLAYEDFDFWVRSSRYFRYYYLSKVLTKRRLHKNQLSKKLYQKNDKQLASTVQVCRTALKLNRTKEESEALSFRVKYEFKKAVSTLNLKEAIELSLILHELKTLTGWYLIAAYLIKLPAQYQKLRQSFSLQQR